MLISTNCCRVRTEAIRERGGPSGATLSRLTWPESWNPDPGRSVAMTDGLHTTTHFFSITATPPPVAADSTSGRPPNNPGEAATDDRDGVVLVRSMGIASAKRSGIFGGVRNNVTLVEAVLRQENVFDLPAALVLFRR